MKKISFIVFLFCAGIYSQEFIVTGTVYNAVPEQCNKNPLLTANMFKLDSVDQYKHKIVALSRDLLKHFPYGSKISIEGTDYDGVYIVEDTMNKRHSCKIDILINKDMKIGKWYNVKIKGL